MDATEMVAGLREYAQLYEKREGIHTGRLTCFAAATAWIGGHASAIADEMAMLAEEVKHLKPLVESTLEENARLRAEVERMRKALALVNQHFRDDSHLRRFPVVWAVIDFSLQPRDAGEVGK